MFLFIFIFDNKLCSMKVSQKYSDSLGPVIFLIFIVLYLWIEVIHKHNVLG